MAYIHEGNAFRLQNDGALFCAAINLDGTFDDWSEVDCNLIPEGEALFVKKGLLIEELLFRSATGEDSIDQRVKALKKLNLSEIAVEAALETAYSWAPVFIDNHIERVEDLLEGLELIADIAEATENAPVAALTADFFSRPSWAWVVGHDLVNCWADDTDTEYVELGRQQP